MKNLNYQPHPSIRGQFAYELHKQMRANSNIWVVTADLGFGMFDKIRDEFPERFINTGAAEETALGIAVGLALEGKVPFVYTITSFYLRAAETIALYLHNEQIPVKLIGSGKDDDYKHDGPSHNGTLAQAYIGSLNIVSIYPETKEEISDVVNKMIANGKPSFVCLKR